MWQEISSISGLPFSRRQGASLHASDDKGTTALVNRQSSLDFDYTTRHVDENDKSVNVSQLQQDLLRSTNVSRELSLLS